MANQEIYLQVFKDSFGIDSDAEAANLEYQQIQAWDSVGHMGLIAELEDAFGIMMDADDIIEFSSFSRGKEILAKYGVAI